MSRAHRPHPRWRRWPGRRAPPRSRRRRAHLSRTAGARARRAGRSGRHPRQPGTQRPTLRKLQGPARSIPRCRLRLGTRALRVASVLPTPRPRRWRLPSDRLRLARLRARTGRSRWPSPSRALRRSSQSGACSLWALTRRGARTQPPRTQVRLQRAAQSLSPRQPWPRSWRTSRARSFPPPPPPSPAARWPRWRRARARP
mmetsp:Transcript_29631/g.69338  ORF Transcript_29631/g.69338 Transcript_29631/m.69338 type:complete len:200 (+) Transcript_29631:642-1241(+)